MKSFKNKFCFVIHFVTCFTCLNFKYSLGLPIVQDTYKHNKELTYLQKKIVIYEHVKLTGKMWCFLLGTEQVLCILSFIRHSCACHQFCHLNQKKQLFYLISGSFLSILLYSLRRVFPKLPSSLSNFSMRKYFYLFTCFKSNILSRNYEFCINIICAYNRDPSLQLSGPLSSQGPASNDYMFKQKVSGALFQPTCMQNVISNTSHLRQ